MRWRWLVATLSAAVLLAGAALPGQAQETSALLQLKLASGTSVRYALHGQVHQDKTTTFSDDSTDSSSTDQVFEQVVRYDVGKLAADGSAEVTMTVEKFTLQTDDQPASTVTDAAQARGRLLPSGALRDMTVVSGTVQDLDRLSIGAFAFEYPTDQLNVGKVIDRAFPLLLLVPWHSERISAHSQTQLTSLTPTMAAVSQEVGLHEADVPLQATITASADATGTAMHTIDRLSGWPSSGRADGKLDTTADGSAGAGDASADAPVPLVITSSIAVSQTYERL